MNSKDINNKKNPIVKIDKKLERFRGKTLFPDKLSQANEILKRVGLPNLEHKTNLNNN